MDPCPACFRPFHPIAWDPEWGAAAGAELGCGSCRVLSASLGLCSLSWPHWVQASALLNVQCVNCRDSHSLHRWDQLLSRLPPTPSPLKPPGLRSCRGVGVQAPPSGYQGWRMLLLPGRSFVPQLLQGCDSPRASRPDVGLQDKEKLYLISLCSTELREG